MKIKFDKIALNVNTPEKFSQNKSFIFFLHGFTGSIIDWNNIINKIDKNFIPICVDLVGHGKSDSPKELNYYTTESQINQLNKVISYFTDDKFVLAGYSMGGRIALSYANKYPENLKGLILESSTYGIKNIVEQKERLQKDEELTEFIISHSIDNFVNRWLNKEIFHSLKNIPLEKYKIIRDEKRKNNKEGLINSLRGFGTGIMPCLFEKLKKIDIPTILITGSLDSKFTMINKEIENQIPNAKHIIISDAGHNTHIEKPEEFIKTVNHFLNEI